MTEGSIKHGEDEQTEARRRAISLFRFLKDLTELRLVPVRDLQKYDEVLWLHEVPRETECDCAAWEIGVARDRPDVWLEVRKPTFTPPPEPSAALKDWLTPVEIHESWRDAPQLSQEISVRVDDEEELEIEDRFQEVALSDHPEIIEQWRRYVDQSWRPWADVDRRAQGVQRIYKRLFSIYQRQKRLGEAYEVVVGIGLLEWKSGVQSVRRQLVFTA